MRNVLLGMLLLGTITATHADQGGLALLGRFGTLGLGLEVGGGLSEQWAIRAGLNGYSVDETLTESNVNYEAELQLRSGGITVDWHPGGHAFRVSLGAFYNGTNFSVLARPTGGTFEFNGVTYNAAEVGSFSGKIEFNKFAPFLGVGFGNVSKKGFSYSIDLGVLYQQSPKVRLDLTCGTTAQCAQLQSDARAEGAQLESELKDFRFWPVIQAGFGYVF
ncbi:MAG: hypothetical protein ACKVQA_20675 [Burkholderiales bacterium]